MLVQLVISATVLLGAVYSHPIEDASSNAQKARDILREVDWVTVATVSTLPNISSYPFGMVKSTSEGTKQNSTGVPYFYLTKMDVAGHDLESNPRCTIVASLVETGYCRGKDYDPQDPRCPKLMMTGRMVKVDQSSAENQFAMQALEWKHPQIRFWPSRHGFYVTKLQIEQLALLDKFGGVVYIDVDDYLETDPSPDSGEISVNRV